MALAGELDFNGEELLRVLSGEEALSLTGLAGGLGDG